MISNMISYTYSLTQESQSELPQRHTRSSSPPAVLPCCWSRLDASPGTRTGVPPWCCRQGGRGLLVSTTTPSIPPPLPPAYLTMPHTVHTLTSPGPSRGGDQALLDRGIPNAIWYHRSGPPTLMGWGSYCWPCHCEHPCPLGSPKKHQWQNSEALG